LSGPDTDRFAAFNLAAALDTGTPTPTTKATYWGIGVPNGVKGNCQGVIWFAALVS
jgi:hypothetical protein